MIYFISSSTRKMVGHRNKLSFIRFLLAQLCLCCSGQYFLPPLYSIKYYIMSIIVLQYLFV